MDESVTTATDPVQPKRFAGLSKGNKDGYLVLKDELGEDGDIHVAICLRANRGDATHLAFRGTFRVAFDSKYDPDSTEPEEWNQAALQEVAPDFTFTNNDEGRASSYMDFVLHLGVHDDVSQMPEGVNIGGTIMEVLTGKVGIQFSEKERALAESFINNEILTRAAETSLGENTDLTDGEVIKAEDAFAFCSGSLGLSQGNSGAVLKVSDLTPEVTVH